MTDPARGHGLCYECYFPTPTLLGLHDDVPPLGGSSAAPGAAPPPAPTVAPDGPQFPPPAFYFNEDPRTILGVAMQMFPHSWRAAMALLEPDEWDRPPMRGGALPCQFEAAAAVDTSPMSALGIAGLFRLPPWLHAVQPGLGFTYPFLWMGDEAIVDERRPIEALFVPYAPDGHTPASTEAGERALAALRARLPGIVDSAAVEEEGQVAFVILLLGSPAEKSAACALANSEGALVLRAAVVADGGPGEPVVRNLRRYVEAVFPERVCSRVTPLAPCLAATPDAFTRWEGASGARSRAGSGGSDESSGSSDSEVLLD